MKQPSSDMTILSKYIRNVGQSVFLLGCVLVLLVGIASFGLGSLEETARTINRFYFLMIIITSIYWIIAGIQIKRTASNALKALATIQIVLITALVCSLVSVIGIILRGKVGVGDLTILLAIYLFVSRLHINKSLNR